MSDFTDNLFYPSAKRIWLYIRLNNAGLSGPAIDLQKMPILANKIIFSDEAHFDLGEYVLAIMVPVPVQRRRKIYIGININVYQRCGM